MASVHTEVTTVGPDLVVTHTAMNVARYEGLAADSVHDLGGMEIRTLRDPGGELLCRFATVNDVHFGETVCGMVADSPDVGPVLRAEPGEPAYPLTMNRGAIAEISAIDPAAVVVKGDLTANGTHAEYEAFLDEYGAFGDRLVHVRGNHDAYHGEVFADFPMQRVDLPGVTLALLDTSIPRKATGGLTEEQLEWLDELAASTSERVLVFGHHHCWDPSSRHRDDGYYGLHPDASERLVDVAVRRRNILGYFAGHTHRNRARHFRTTGTMPWVEVACVKDYPGAWVEYRVHEGGIVHLHHRISTPEALDWTERTRGMFSGHYADYAFGALADRCFLVER